MQSLTEREKHLVTFVAEGGSLADFRRNYRPYSNATSVSEQLRKAVRKIYPYSHRWEGEDEYRTPMAFVRYHRLKIIPLIEDLEVLNKGLRTIESRLKDELTEKYNAM